MCPHLLWPECQSKYHAQVIHLCFLFTSHKLCVQMTNHHMRIWHGSTRSYSVLRLNFVLGVFAELRINSGDWPERCFTTVHHQRLRVLRSTGRIARKREDDRRNERNVRRNINRSKMCSWPCTNRQLTRNVQVSSQDSIYALVPDQPDLHSTQIILLLFQKKRYLCDK